MQHAGDLLMIDNQGTKMHLSLAICGGQSSTASFEQGLAAAAAGPGLQAIHCCQGAHLRTNKPLRREA